ncbi:right-handed parallel beta-helix repeat-containing protein [Micromonospora mirobrigensis]|uniref:Nitrous oxidase accessory protein NosD, contains tandem CASH domains n=1 Tax=Micromonospora mirobrigensis TaxID=262898 RepID=A0A1C4VN70_9ACTN|nr:right-handed parallel beta-helix repeat-containing protein [Micromonospora mirobrigensis]SCE85464.1 Nitrous oxidase accessory protein NosD, contains tandem CASH domains [Micromonospora mirobrigensis]
MHRSSLAGLTAVAVTGGALLAASPAQAADPTYLYVDKNSTACSDSGPGSQSAPFCTIGAAAGAATAGTVVRINSGTYSERVTVSRSGTADQPITFEGIGTGADQPLMRGGPDSGFVIDGQHDVVLRNLRIDQWGWVPALDVRNASGIRISGVTADNSHASPDAQAPISFTAVRGATVEKSSIESPYGTGVWLDAATTGVTVTSSRFGGSGFSDGRSTGVLVYGSDNKIIGNEMDASRDGAISIEPGAARTVVANNVIDTLLGRPAIVTNSADSTTIVNNSMTTNCGDGIRVQGNSSGVIVQNNVIDRSPEGDVGNVYCATYGAAILVAGNSAVNTVVDYNDVSGPAGQAYSWNGTYLTLAAFRSATGKAAHDRSNPANHRDSANSAAPGYPMTDRLGVARIDDLGLANTGAGPIAYADRGATEAVPTPSAALALTVDPATLSVIANAGASKPGAYPIASYRFDFGDGTVITQASPIARRYYPLPGTYTVSVKVIPSSGPTSETSQTVSALRRISTVSLLAADNLRYVAPAGELVQANRYGVDSTDKFDLVDAGNAQVAVFSQQAQRYLTTNGSDPLRLNSLQVGVAQRFVLTAGAGGTVSLKSTANGRYVSVATTGYLYANKTSVGVAEKFHRVGVNDANSWFKARVNLRYVTSTYGGKSWLVAKDTSVSSWQRYDLVNLGSGKWALFSRANNRFVTAENGGAKPLIANRTSIGQWETFTILHNTDGTVSLRAAANNRIITADSAGTKPLIANRTTIGLWEKFTLG